MAEFYASSLQYAEEHFQKNGATGSPLYQIVKEGNFDFSEIDLFIDLVFGEERISFTSTKGVLNGNMPFQIDVFESGEIYLTDPDKNGKVWHQFESWKNFKLIESQLINSLFVYSEYLIK